MNRFGLQLFVFCLTVMQYSQAADIRGKVVSVLGGEPLGKVRVTVLETHLSADTRKDGSFEISGLISGQYTLQLSAVGFRLLNVRFAVADQEPKKFSITMVPDNFRRTDTVEVHGNVFEEDTDSAPSKFTLNASELKEASTVLADDPFRAVQAMPGISPTANNDFLGEFSVTERPVWDPISGSTYAWTSPGALPIGT